jgi:serine/threonine protein kinase
VTQAASFSSGELIGGRYTVKEHLGSGGMGQVYACWDEVLAETVALKTVLSTFVTDAEMLIGLRKEATLARRVSHPNVCRVHDLGHHRREGQAVAVPFLTMQLLTGVTLTQWLGSQNPSSARIMHLAMQILEGLKAIHDASVVHGDLKAENVMVVEGGASGERAVIMDFGVSHPMRNQSGPSSDEFAFGHGGTAAYTAPEVMRGAVPSARSDIYSFGVMLFEMLTRRIPLMGASFQETAALRLYAEPPKVGAFGSAVEKHVEDVITRCLAAAPEDRPSSVASLRDWLSGFES